MPSWCLVVICLSLCATETPAAQPAFATTDSSAAVSQRGEDRWLSEDKIDHVSAGAFLVGAQYYLFRSELERSHEQSIRAAIAGTLVLGVAKEVYDGISGRGSPSFKDAAADVLGVALAALLLRE